MAGNRPDISVELALENDRFKRELRESLGVAERTLGGLQSLAGGASRAFAALGAGLSAAGLASFVRSGIDAADKLGEIAEQSGVTAEEFSKLAFAAKFAGVEQETLSATLQRLSRNSEAAARGSKTQADVFERLGVSVTDAEGRLRSVDSIFRDTAEALSRLPDGAEKSALAIGALGRNGARLLPVLNGGREGLAEFSAEAERLGVVVSTQAAQDAGLFNDQLDKIRATSQGVAIQLGTDLLPALNNIVEAFRRGYEQGGLFDATLDGLKQIGTEALGDPLQNQIEDTEEAISKLKDQLKALKGETFFGGTQKAVRDFFAADNMIDIDRVTASISRQEKRLADLRQLRDDLRKPAAPSAGRAPAGASEPAGNVIVDEADAKRLETERERIRKAQESALSNLRKQLELQDESNELAKVEADIRFGTARQFDKATQDELRQLADKVDRLNEEAEVHEYLIKLERERREEAAQTSAALAQERAKVIESLRTPEEEYAAEVRKLMDLGIGGESLQRGIDKARESLESARDKTKETTDAARELGFAFESAFESAVLEAESFGDVLKGLLQDLVKIGLRETVTDPLAEAAKGLFSGLTSGGGGGIGDFFKGLFGNANGGLYRIGGAGTAERPVMLTGQPGEMVAVGRFAEGGSGKTTVNIINPPAQPQVRESIIDGEKKVDILFNRSFGRSVSRGDLAGVGLPPPLASR